MIRRSWRPLLRETPPVIAVLVLFAVATLAMGRDYFWGAAFFAALALCCLARLAAIPFQPAEAMILDDLGVRWRDPGFRSPMKALAWRDIAVARLDDAVAGRSRVTTIILSLREPRLNRGGKAMADPRIPTRLLDGDPEAVLEAFGRYVFFQDVR